MTTYIVVHTTEDGNAEQSTSRTFGSKLDAQNYAATLGAARKPQVVKLATENEVPTLDIDLSTDEFLLGFTSLHTVRIPLSELGFCRLAAIMRQRALCISRGRRPAIGERGAPTQSQVEKMVRDFDVRKRKEAKAEIADMGIDIDSIDLGGIEL